MPQTVSLTAMKNGVRADYKLLERLEAEYAHTLPDRLPTAWANWRWFCGSRSEKTTGLAT